MSALDLLNAPPLWAELSPGALHLWNGAVGEDVPCVTGPDGGPDPETQARVAAALARLAPRRPWQTRAPLSCAISARGVSIRRFQVPRSGPDELRSLLQLQVEAAFPVPPDQLAWGWIDPGPPGDQASSPQLCETTVVAVRKEALQGWSDLFSRAGFIPVFTLAAVARAALAGAGCAGALTVGVRETEFVKFDAGAPSSARIFDWGAEVLVEAVARALAVTPDQARQTCAALSRDESAEPARRAAVLEASQAAVEVLAARIRGSFNGARIQVFIPSSIGRLTARLLEPALRPTTLQLQIEAPRSPGETAAVLGLHGLTTRSGGRPTLRLDLNPSEAAGAPRTGLSARPWRWPARAAALFLALLALPYAEAFVGRPLLSHRLSVLEKDRSRLGEIDRRLEFLEHLADNQPPYVDAVFVIAGAMPPGMHLDALNMNKQGEVSISGYTQMPQQVVDFRSKLADSKFFSSVVVEEQTPIVGGPQRTNLRITAQWKGPAEREALALGPAIPAPAKTNAPGPAGAPTNQPPASKQK